MFQAICDVEISLLIPMFGKEVKTFDSDVLLANALPQKEHLLTIICTLISYLDKVNSKMSNIQVMDGVLRCLEIIGETEFGMSYLKE